MQTEIRTLPITVEVRAASADGGPTISGHGAVFAPATSLDLGGFREQIDAKAFNRTLKEGGYGGVIRSYFNHDPHYVLGRTDNQTLTVKRDKVGIAFEVTPPDTQWARDLMVSLQRADIADASFAFRVLKDSWEELPDGTQLRTLLDVDLMEIGPVSQGAYPAADSQVRSMLEQRGIKLGETAEEKSTDVLVQRMRDLGYMLGEFEGAAFDETFLDCMLNQEMRCVNLLTLGQAKASRQDIRDYVTQALADCLAEIDLLRAMEAGDTSQRSEQVSAPEAWAIAAESRRRALKLLSLAQ